MMDKTKATKKPAKPKAPAKKKAGKPALRNKQVSQQAEKKKLHPEMEKKKWKPGQSGNPAGRPKNYVGLTDKLDKILKRPIADAPEKIKALLRNSGFDIEKMQELIIADAVALATMLNAMKGNPAALKEVWNRIEGKVPDEMKMDLIGDSILGMMQKFGKKK